MKIIAERKYKNMKIECTPEEFKELMSEIAKTRIGKKNPMFGRKQSDRTIHDRRAQLGCRNYDKKNKNNRVLLFY